MEIFQKGKLSPADEILTPDFVLHNPVLPYDFIKGPESEEICIRSRYSLPGHQFPHHGTMTTKDRRYWFDGHLLAYPKETF